MKINLVLYEQKKTVKMKAVAEKNVYFGLEAVSSSTESAAFVLLVKYYYITEAKRKKKRRKEKKRK